MSPAKTTRAPKRGPSQIWTAVSSGTQVDKADMTKVWSQPARGGLTRGYTAFTTAEIDGQLYLLAYKKSRRKVNLDAYALNDSAPYVGSKLKTNIALAPSQFSYAKPPVNYGWDILDSFVLANQPYLMAYCSKTGSFAYIGLSVQNGVLTGTIPYFHGLYRNEPTQNFTTVKTMTYHGQVIILAYNAAKPRNSANTNHGGYVATFTIAAVSRSIGGKPPLEAVHQFYHQWASGWEHFAFFQLGGENFFFKINEPYPNVNIDHLDGNPASGTREVHSHLDTRPWMKKFDFYSYTNVQPIPWKEGQPHLLTYVADSGVAEVNRVWASCDGWINVARQKVSPGASQIVTYYLNKTGYALFYTG